MSDILYLVKTKEGDVPIYLLIEHQSRPDQMIAWRMMHYAFCTMNQHLQQGYKSLPLVVPILFYHGKKKPYPLDCQLTEKNLFTLLKNYHNHLKNISYLLI